MFMTYMVSNITGLLGDFSAHTENSYTAISDMILECASIKTIDEVTSRDIVKLLAGPDLTDLCDFGDTFRAATLSAHCGSKIVINMFGDHWELWDNLSDLRNDEEMEDEEKEVKRKKHL